MLDYYNNGLLQRWLSVRGYESELAAVTAISATDPMQIIKELIRIFDIVTDEKKVEESVYILNYLNERKELVDLYDKENYKTSSIINDYMVGYYQLVKEIFDNPNDAAVIKAVIAEIVDHYSWILNLNHKDLFWMFEREEMYLAIMCLLMNETSRTYYLPSASAEDTDTNEQKFKEEVADAVAATEKNAGFTAMHMLPSMYFRKASSVSPESTQTTSSTSSTSSAKKRNDKDSMFESICKMITLNSFYTNLGENLLRFSGLTDGYWKDLEPKGKKYMIISMGAGDYVRSSGVSGGDLSSSDVSEKFVIVDGIDYKSNSATRELLYMEV